MNKIIVPVDFSLNSENALKTAAYFAKENNAEILVIHFLELSNAIISVSDSYIQEETVYLFKIAEKKIKEFLNKEYLAQIKVTPIIKYHKSFYELSEIAESEKANLIIMGSHGASGLKEVFIGSNAEKVVRTSKIPVLIVKDSPIENNFEDIAFISDFSDENIEMFKQTKEIINVLGGEMKLIYVNTPYDNFKTSMQMKNKVLNFLYNAEEKGQTLDKVVFLNHFSVEGAVTEYIETYNTDLIVIGTHGRRGLSHFFQGSISEDVVNHLNVPVLTLRI